MNNIEQLFAERKAFIGYITAGHRGLDYTKEAAIALAKGGVDILEIGIPFSDPIADGPVIQQAMTQALQSDVTFESILKTIKAIKHEIQTPIILFTYLNPLLAIGYNNALAMAAQAGVDGVLIVDLPLEEAEQYFQVCKAHGIDPVCLISPSTSPQRMHTIDEYCHSFLYYVCRNGTTGVKKSLPDDYITKMREIRDNTRNPVVSGFGIGDQTTAKQVLEHADGFVVGSAFVKAILEGASPEDLQQLANSIDPRY